MPPVIAFLASGSFLANLAITTGLTAIKFGLSYMQRKRVQSRTSSAQSRQTRSISNNISITPSPRYVVYGLARPSCVTTFMEADGNDLYIVSALSDDSINKVQAFYVRNIEVLTAKRDGFYIVTTPPFNSTSGKYVKFEVKTGGLLQTRPALLGAAFPGRITLEHRSAGVSLGIAKITQPPEDEFQNMFGGGIPDLSYLLRGAHVWDSRSTTQDPTLASTWGYRTNNALILQHYMTAANGMDLSRSIFDVSTFNAVADVCDELINTKTKGQRKRYEMGATVYSDADPYDNVQRMLDSFDGDIYTTEAGYFGLTCPEVETPTITITEANILEFDGGPRVGALMEFSSVLSKYTSEDHGYLELGESSDPWIDEPTLALIGRDIPFQHDLPYVFRHDQVRRLQKRRWYDLNPDWVINFTTDYTGLELIGERVFFLKYAPLELDIICRIETLDVAQDFTTVTVSARSYNLESLEWDELTEEGSAPAVAPPSTDGGAPQTPSGLTVLVGNDGGIQAFFSWSTPPTGKTVEAQYKLASSSIWSTAALGNARDNDTTVTGLVSAENYNFRVRFVAVGLGVSPWATINFAATPTAGTTGALGSFSAAGDVLKVVLDITQSSAPTAAYVQVSVVENGTAANWVGAPKYDLKSGGSGVIPVTRSEAGAVDCFARSVGINGDIGSVSGPLNATVQAQPVDPPDASSGSDGNDGPQGPNVNDGGSKPPAAPFDDHPLYGDNPGGAGLYDGGAGDDSDSLY